VAGSGWPVERGPRMGTRSAVTWASAPSRSRWKHERAKCCLDGVSVAGDRIQEPMTAHHQEGDAVGQATPCRRGSRTSSLLVKRGCPPPRPSRFLPASSGSKGDHGVTGRAQYHASWYLAAFVTPATAYGRGDSSPPVRCPFRCPFGGVRLLNRGGAAGAGCSRPG